MSSEKPTRAALYARVSQEGIDTSTPMGRMVFTIIGALTEFEKNLIRERVVAGLQARKKRGKALG